MGPEHNGSRSSPGISGRVGFSFRLVAVMAVCILAAWWGDQNPDAPHRLTATVVVFLGATLPASILHRVFEARSDELSGTLLGSGRFQLTGIAGTYLLCACLMLFAMNPQVFGVNREVVLEEWAYTVESDSTFGLSRAGEIQLWNAPLGSRRVAGRVGTGPSASPFRPGGVAVRAYGTMFLTLRPPGDIGELIAFGGIGPNASAANLHLTRLKTRSSETNAAMGQINLQRRWPWDTVALVVATPLVVVALLAGVARLVATLELRLPIPEWMEALLVSVTMRIAGASVVYAVVAVGALYFAWGFPRSLDDSDSGALAACASMSGRWNFHLLHRYQRKYLADYVGHFVLDCDEEGVAASGITNQVFDPNSDFVEGSGCYDHISIGGEHFAWESIAGAVSERGILLVYASDESAAEQEELGVLRGILRAGADDFKWTFRDLENIERPQSAVNSGEMLLFRPGSDRQTDCSALQRRRRRALL